MSMNKRKTDVIHSSPPREEPRVDSVTATEMIDGVRCLLILEQDVHGRYQETSIRPMESAAGQAV